MRKQAIDRDLELVPEGLFGPGALGPGVPVYQANPTGTALERDKLVELLDTTGVSHSRARFSALGYYLEQVFANDDVFDSYIEYRLAYGGLAGSGIELIVDPVQMRLMEPMEPLAEPVLEVELGKQVQGQIKQPPFHARVRHVKKLVRYVSPLIKQTPVHVRVDHVKKLVRYVSPLTAPNLRKVLSPLISLRFVVVTFIKFLILERAYLITKIAQAESKIAQTESKIAQESKIVSKIAQERTAEQIRQGNHQLIKRSMGIPSSVTADPVANTVSDGSNCVIS